MRRSYVWRVELDTGDPKENEFLSVVADTAIEACRIAEESAVEANDEMDEDCITVVGVERDFGVFLSK